ncbi:MAG: GFA family protein [Rhodospirillales bacterium]
MPAPYKGGCQCGAVRFEISAEPLTAYVCHCITCQKQSGSAFGMAIVVPTDAIAVLEGGTSTFIKTADSGRESDCVFCPKCGNRLFHHIKTDAAMSMVKTGLLDDASDIIPVAHLWTSRALNWVTIPNDVLIFEGQPEVGMGSLIEAYKGS